MPTLKYHDGTGWKSLPTGGGALPEATVYRSQSGPTLALNATWGPLDPRAAGVVIEPAGSFIENADKSVSVRDAGWYDVSAQIGTVGIFDGSIHGALGSVAVGTDLALGQGRGNPQTGAVVSLATALYLTPASKVFCTGYASAAASLQVVHLTIARIGGPKGDTGGNATVAMDVVHFVGGSGEPAFQNSWKNYDNDAAAPSANPLHRSLCFRKDPLGKVLLAGTIKGGSHHTVAFTLPAGHCPAIDLGFSISAAAGMATVLILANGGVIVSNSVTSNVTAYAFLDGLTFDTGTVTQMPTGPQGPKGDTGNGTDIYAQLAQSTTRPFTAIASQVWTWIPVPPSLTITSASGSPDFTRNADGTLTINVAGNYHFEASVQATVGMADNTSWHLVLCRKAGALPELGDQIGQFNFTTGTQANNYPTAHVSADQVCAVGDRIGTYMWQSAAATNVTYIGFSAFKTGTGPQGPKGDTGGNATVPIEAWHTVGAAGEPAYQGAWGPHVAGPYAAKFRKRPDGVVELDGMVRGGTTGVVFTLPTGYTPYGYGLNALYLPALVSSKYVGYITITGTGLVNVEASAGQSIVAGDWISLQGLKFSTDQTTFPTGPQGPPGPGVRGLVTALPTSPQDGDECYFQDVAMAALGVVWHLRYRTASTSANKWEFLGGGSITARADAQSVVTSGWSGGHGPLIRVPLSGDYMVSMSCSPTLPGTAQVAMGLLGAANFTQTALTNHPSGEQFLSRPDFLFPDLLAGSDVSLAFFAGVAGVTVGNRNLSIHPVRAR
jgi:hypothetical protein